jgi:Ca2+:H+ antiporter
VIWNNEIEEKKTQEVQNTMGHQHPVTPHNRLQRQASANEAARGAEIRDSQLYKRILGQPLKQVGLGHREEGSQYNSPSESTGPDGSTQIPQTPHLVPPKSNGGDSPRNEPQFPGLFEAQNANVVREVAEIAATAAAIAARDATKGPRRSSAVTSIPQSSHKPTTLRAGAVADDEVATAEALDANAGGHDAPNWSRTKSSVILCVATILYALIAEILVNTVDVVLKNVAVDEKFLGITLFALVPNTTEFLVRSRCTPIYPSAI